MIRKQNDETTLRLRRYENEDELFQISAKSAEFSASYGALTAVLRAGEQRGGDSEDFSRTFRRMELKVCLHNLLQVTMLECEPFAAERRGLWRESSSKIAGFAVLRHQHITANNSGTPQPISFVAGSPYTMEGRLPAVTKAGESMQPFAAESRPWAMVSAKVSTL